MHATATLLHLLLWFGAGNSYQFYQVQQAPVPGRPQYDDKPIYSDSYLPACMQVIGYLADLMKFDITTLNKPQRPTSRPTTTTSRSTPAHRPGLYAPQRPPTTPRYIDGKYKVSKENTPTKSENTPYENRLPKDLTYLAENPKKILQQINRIDDFDYIGESEFAVEDFGKNYDDEFNEEFLRLPRIPPTRAYVTLLSLYDMLNKEAKRQGLTKFSGYSKTIMQTLIGTSTGSAGDQLKLVLSKMLERNESKRSDANRRAKMLIQELDKADSALAMQIRYYPPLKFAS